MLIDFPWVLWLLKSPVTWLLLQQVVETISKEGGTGNITDPLSRWLVGSPSKRPIMRKSFICHDFTMLWLYLYGQVSILIHSCKVTHAVLNLWQHISNSWCKGQTKISYEIWLENFLVSNFGEFFIKHIFIYQVNLFQVFFKCSDKANNNLIRTNYKYLASPENIS